ncbi:MAG: calcium-translocating P-type ATPase, SERCA-type [archaeon]|nr:calcium-translocating P-type ATPase, SERCA-type [archaeon]
MTKEDSLLYTLSADDILKQLKTSTKGLSGHEAEERLHKYGLNEIKREEGIGPLKILFSQFSSPLVWILIVALGISIALSEYIDASVIGVIIIVNAILGFSQEYRAEKAIEALQRMTSQKAKVLRDGREIKIESRYLVPGDIVFLETGDRVPADARLIEIHNLQTQEGSLTGESQPVRKNLELSAKKTALGDRKSMVFSSTIVTQGRATAVVTGTGMQSEIGKIATLITQSQQQLTPLQQKLRDLGKYLTIAVVAVAVVVFIVRLLAGDSFSETLLTAIALAVAAIPEGLPAVITIALSIGVQRMAKKNSLVRKLPSVETLGSVNVICTDKTGTLTHDQMTVQEIWADNNIYKVTGSGYSPEGKFLVNNKLANPNPLHLLLKIGSLCNDAKFQSAGKGEREVIGDPTEAALIVSAEKAGFIQKDLLGQEKRIDEIAFTSERKMMTTIHQGKKKLSYTKGAPDIVIDLCDQILISGKVVRLDRGKKKEILAQNEMFAKKALRVLGFAYNEGFKKTEDAEKGMIFVGLQAMIDPPREEVKDSIKRCQDAGIRVIMITGDHLITAQAIAKELGIFGRAVSGVDIEKLNLEKDIKDINIFARVNPEHKLDIVDALQKNGHIVAMTGDGVNDAPALKKADIGVSMGITGTDVAKEASDMILTDDNFTSIVNAIEEGRGIFDNIRKFVNYLLSSNLGEIAVILFASLIGLPLPLTAIQILWVNLVTDGLPATALGLDPHSKGIMMRKPRPPRESILSRELRWDIIAYGLLMGVGVIILFWLYQGSTPAKAQTIAFTTLVLFEMVRIHTIRKDYGLSIFSNKWLIAAVVGSLLLQLSVIYTPLSKIFKTEALALIDWGIMLLACAILYIVYLLIERWLKKEIPDTV